MTSIVEGSAFAALPHLQHQSSGPKAIKKAAGSVQSSENLSKGCAVLVIGVAGLLGAAKVRRHRTITARSSTSSHANALLSPVLSLLGSKEGALAEEVAQLTQKYVLGEIELGIARKDIEILRTERDEAISELQSTVMDWNELASKQAILKSESAAAQTHVAELNAVLEEKNVIVRQRQEMAIVLQADIDRLKTEKGALEDAVVTWKTAKASIEKGKAESEKAAEAKLAELQKELHEASVAREQEAAQSKLETSMLKNERDTWETAAYSWKLSKGKLEDMQAQRKEEAEAMLAKAQAEVMAADTASEETVRKLQVEIESLKVDNQGLEKAVYSWKMAKDSLDKIQAEKDKASSEELSAKEATVLKLQDEINNLRSENQSLEKSVQSWKEAQDKLSFQMQTELADLKASKKNLEEMQAKKDQAAESRIAEAHAAVMQAQRAKEEIAAKMQSEMQRLTSENQSLVTAVSSIKASKQELEQMQAKKDKAAEAKITEAQAAAMQAQRAKEEIAAKMQSEMQRLTSEKQSLGTAVSSMKASKQELEQMQAKKDKAAEAKITEAQAAMMKAQAAKEELYTQTMAEMDRLKAENLNLAKALGSWKISKQELEQMQAKKDQAAESRIAEAQAAVMQVQKAKEDIAASMQLEVERLRTENQTLGNSTCSLKATKEKLESLALERNKTTDSRLADAARAVQAAHAATEEVAKKLRLETERLESEKSSLAQAVIHWKTSKEELENVFAKKEREVEARIAEAQASAVEKAEQDRIVSHLRAEMNSLMAQKTALEESVDSWKKAKDQLEADNVQFKQRAQKALADVTQEKQSLAAKLLTVLPQESVVGA